MSEQERQDYARNAKERRQPDAAKPRGKPQPQVVKAEKRGGRRTPVDPALAARVLALARQNNPRLLHREIADRLGMPAGTVGLLINRAIHRGELAPRGVVWRPVPVPR